MTLGVCEVGDHEIGPRLLFRAHPARPAEALGLLERSLDVGDPDVKDHVAIVAQTTPGISVPSLVVFRFTNP